MSSKIKSGKIAPKTVHDPKLYQIKSLCYTKPSVCYVMLTCSSVVQTAYICEQRTLVTAVASSSQYFMGARLDVLHEGVKIVVRQPTREDSRITLWGAIWYVKQ